MFGGGDEIYQSLMMGLDLCEAGEQLLEEKQFKEANKVLTKAWRMVEPCIDSADYCGYGKRCDRYCARIQAALARCKMESSTDSPDSTAVPKEVLQQMREALPNDGLNPDAHLDFAKALITSLGFEFCQNQANWLDERYVEAHYHASVACALKRANKMDGQHQGMGRGQDAPGTVPSSVKKAFADLGDDGGWKRVIFCTSETSFCSWLEADAAAAALTAPTPENKDFQKKKATFVLLNGSYPLTMSMSNCQVDIYGIVDQHRKVEILTRGLRVKAGSRLRLCSLHIKEDTTLQPPLLSMAEASCVSMLQITINQGQNMVGPVVETNDNSFLALHDCSINSTDFSDTAVLQKYNKRTKEDTAKTEPQVVVQGSAGILGVGTTASLQFAGQADDALQIPKPTPAPWTPSTGTSNVQPPGSRAAFFVAMRQLAQASVGLSALGRFSKYLKGSSVVLCSTSSELELALCSKDGPESVIACLVDSALAISKPLQVKEAVLIGVLSTSCCEMAIEVGTDDGRVNFDCDSGTLEVHNQNMTAFLTVIDIDVKVKSTSTPPFLRQFQRLMAAHSAQV